MLREKIANGQMWSCQLGNMLVKALDAQQEKLRLSSRQKIVSEVRIPDRPSFDDDEGEQEEAEERSESDDEGDADGVLAVDVQRRRERRQDGAVL